ncbi:MAG: DeoR family transcriptional regulator, partial [Pseudobdellovibrio sp.]
CIRDRKEATNKLNEISGSIFQNQNRRQEARLNLRWAEIYYLKNEPNTCLHYIRSGRRCLEFVDHTYEIQFLGLEKKVYEQLLQQSSPQTIVDRLNELSIKFNNIKNNNILARDANFKNIKFQSSDDEIHHLLEKAGQNAKAARNIILDTSYLTWLYRFFDLEKGEKYILLNLEPKSITYLTTEGIFHVPSELSTLNYKILTKLSKGYTTKEELVQSVWGYTYDPLRHDSLIYSTFSNIRKILKHDNRLIETSEMGYTLNAKVINLLQISKQDDNSRAQTPIQNTPNSVNLSVWLNSGLNSRQIQIMQYLDSQQFISVKAVIKLFSTSEITANRDLRTLFQKKLVLRVGQGRATQYIKAGNL